MKYYNMLFSFLFLLLLFSCNDDNELKETTIKVKYVESICCGDLMTLNNQLVNSSCETYRDSLLVPINKDDFTIFQSLQIGDEINIEYELTELCEGRQTCNITCNRAGGIPIKILNIENN